MSLDWKEASDNPPFDTDVLCYDRSGNRLFVGQLSNGVATGKSVWSDEEAFNVRVDYWAQIDRPTS